MAFSVGYENEVKSEPNVVPLCDVLLVLLIIFMVVTPLIQQGVDVNLPPALNATSMPDNPDVILYLKTDGSYYVNEERTSPDNFLTKLDDAFIAASDKKLYLRADEGLNYGKIVDVFLEVQTIGVDVVGIITEAETTKEE
ncbi:MAG: ExbD/TolR family protein [Candidatus Aminicenantaceae bacterium]